MQQYELMLVTSSLAYPRQFKVNVNSEIDGAQMAELLSKISPVNQWFLFQSPLETCHRLPMSHKLVLTDVPRDSAKLPSNTSGLKLYVPDGPDAGAYLNLSPGKHEIGRCPPLSLSDPKISRLQAQLEVNERWLKFRMLGSQAVSLKRAAQNIGLREEVDLSINDRLHLGNTTMVLGDPSRNDASQQISIEELDFHLPDAPEVQRLIALCLAALIPIISGILLALLTGSILFLVVSGLSASLGLFPAGQIITDRRRWKTEALLLRTRAVTARRMYAPDLGMAVISGLERTALGILPATVPPLVFGIGTWNLPGLFPATARSQKRAKASRLARRDKSARIDSVPIFAPSKAEAWQIVSPINSESLSLLFAVLSRFLPNIVSGQVQLVLDPDFSQLPPEVLLLNNVSQAPIAEIAARREDLVSTHGLFSNTECTTFERIYVTSKPVLKVPNVLVLSVNPLLSDDAQYWIDPSMLRAQLPDERLSLEQLQVLSTDRFVRLVLQYLEHQPANDRAIEAMGQVSSESSLRAVIGSDANHNLQILDFDVDGPHVLICGTTGSGKSEALRRIIVDLARRYSPERVAFALIDFKGGAGLSVFAELPHVQLSTSDLDQAEAQRTLTQLEHEIRRRERIFQLHGCSDLFEYNELADAPVVPRLIVVIDEFKVFVESLSEASSRVDRIAAVGRSLGIHLVLSTQRASGSVSAQTRANINTVIALRVSDVADSMELVGNSAAAKLTLPGSAYIRTTDRSSRRMQFALAIDAEPYGSIYERSPASLILHRLVDFGSVEYLPNRHELSGLVESIQSSWKHQLIPQSGFAEALPQPEQRWPENISVSGLSDSAACYGLIDQIDDSTLQPLAISFESTPGLLICGVPQAGARPLIKMMLCEQTRTLLIGADNQNADLNTEFVRTLDGKNRYEFNEAISYLERYPCNEPLRLLVCGVANLQSSLDPGSFQRFDQLLSSILRKGSATSIQVVIAVDRDQNLLKASSLCVEQWYFPLEASDALTMGWPKLPPCSQIAGRGVRVTASSPPMIIQLLTPPAPAKSVCRSGRWVDSSNSNIHETVEEFHLGNTSFRGTPYRLSEEGTTFIICAQREDRETLSQMLSNRWSSVLLHSIAEIEQWLVDRNACPRPTTDPILCIELSSTSFAELATLYQRLKEAGSKLVFFIPPSPRLQFDFGIAGMGLDERDVVAVEAEHAHDLQPMNWPPLPFRLGTTNVEGKRCWRAIAHFEGQLHPLIITRN